MAPFFLLFHFGGVRERLRNGGERDRPRNGGDRERPRNGGERDLDLFLNLTGGEFDRWFR